MIDFKKFGIMAYRSENIKEAIELLLQAVDLDSGDWLSRLYLAMSYRKANKLVDAHRLLLRISKECPDIEIALSAELALPELSKQVSDYLARMRAAADTQDKTQPVLPARGRRRDDDDIVWIG